MVAKVGDEVITLSDFEAQLNQQNPLIRARYKSLEQKKKLVESLVEREAMFAEAMRLGLDKDPDMIRGYKKILARHLVNVEFNKKRVKEIQISDEEIAKYYQDNHDRYHSPEKVRVHHIFIAKGPKAAKSKAKSLLAQLKAKPNDRRLFLELARKNSEDATTKNIGGDLNFKTQAQLEELWGGAFAKAAFALQKANDLSDILTTKKGYHILRQSGKQAKIDLALEQVKGQIRTTLFARARGEAYKSFVEDVKKRVGIRVNDEVIAKAKLDTSASEKRSFPNALKRPPRGKINLQQGPPKTLGNPANKPVKPKNVDKAQSPAKK